MSKAAKPASGNVKISININSDDLKTTMLNDLVAKHVYGCLGKYDLDPLDPVDNLVITCVGQRHATFENRLDDYAATWDASRVAPNGTVMPEWAHISVEDKAACIGLDISNYAIKIRDCANDIADRIAASTDDPMPRAWEIECS